MNSNQIVELDSKDFQVDQQELHELIESELAFIGGGCGDVIIK